MNILIIDDLLIFEKAWADSPKKAAFFRLMGENFRRRLFLAKEFENLGANVLLARIEPTQTDTESAFIYRESSGISQVFVPVKVKGLKRLYAKELLAFCAGLSDNFKSLSGLFKPDVVIAAGVLPFCAAAAAKIAESAGAVLITELSCSPAELLKRLGLCSALDPVLMLINRSLKTVFKKSDAVIGLFPDAHLRFQNARGLYPMFSPAFYEEKPPSDEAKQQKENLSAFGEGNTFVLACPLPIESGFFLEELITVCSGFGNKFALVFLAEGSSKNALRRFISEKGITNVYFSDAVKPEDMSFVLSAADGIFLSENYYTKGLSAESELFFSAFCAGKPIIAGAEHFSELFRKSGGTIITKPRNRDSTRLGIKTLMDMSLSDREALGLSCKTFGEQNSKKDFALDYYSLMDNLVKQKEIKQ